jgi:hypothetical protein
VYKPAAPARAPPGDSAADRPSAKRQRKHKHGALLAGAPTLRLNVPAFD